MSVGIPLYWGVGGTEIEPGLLEFNPREFYDKVWRSGVIYLIYVIIAGQNGMSAIPVCLMTDCYCTDGL